jgi:hypothetical protein
LPPLRAAIGAGVALGWLPDAGLALSMSFRWLEPHLGVDFVWLPPRDRAVEDTGATVRFASAMFGAHICPPLVWSRTVSLAGCLGLRAGWVSVGGVGFDRNHHRNVLALSAHGAAELTVTILPWLSLGPRLELSVHPDGRRFSYDDAAGRERDVWTLGVADGRASLLVAVSSH